MSASRILAYWAVFLALVPLGVPLFGGRIDCTHWACWGAALVMAACAWATSGRVRTLLIRQLVMALAIVSTLAIALFAMRSMLDHARNLALSGRPEIVRLVEVHNAGLPEGFPNRIEVAAPSSPQVGPASILGFIVVGMLVQQSLQSRGRLQAQTSHAAIGEA